MKRRDEFLLTALICIAFLVSFLLTYHINSPPEPKELDRIPSCGTCSAMNPIHLRLDNSTEIFNLTIGPFKNDEAKPFPDLEVNLTVGNLTVIVFTNSHGYAIFEIEKALLLPHLGEHGQISVHYEGYQDKVIDIHIPIDFEIVK